jgi:chorismate mutase
VIRLLVHCYAEAESPARHVYLREAAALRRDLQGAQ